MSLESSALLKADYAAVKSQLASMGVPVPKAAEADAAHAHRLVYSLCLWNYRLTDLPDRAGVFLAELASDALQFLPQALMGYKKTSALLTRGLTEDTLRHIYFSDHPVEFRRDNAMLEWHMSTVDLWDYAFRHPDLATAEKNWAALARMKGAYSDLSQVIHASKVIHHQAKRALAEIEFDPGGFRDQVKQLAIVAASANYLIAVFRFQELGHMPPRERSIILRTMPTAARAALNSL